MYTLKIIDGINKERIVIEDSDPKKIRNITFKIKKKLGRKIVINFNGKDLLGGHNALDKMIYEKWLEENQPK
jgi:hypothetical protein